MTVAAGRERRELVSLTSLRGIAAMAVVLQHFSATAQEYCLVTIPSLVPHGYVGVDFFFTLSGFIMAYNYAATFQAQGFRFFRSFLLKRVARVVPLNVAVLIVLALAGWLSWHLAGRNIFFETGDALFDFAANVLMLQGFGVGTNLNGPSWSISTEFAAYLLFPLFVVLVGGRRIQAWCAAVIALAAICWLAASRPRLGLGFEGPPGSIVRCFSEFALGMVSYRLFGSEWLCRTLRSDGVTIFLTLAVAASLAARYDLPAVLLMPLLIVAYAANDGISARLVQWQPLYFLGLVSYSLYLIHNPFRPLEMLLLRHTTSGPVGPVAALSFAATGSLSIIPVAWLAYVTVERPGRTFVRSLIGLRPARAITAQPDHAPPREPV